MKRVAGTFALFLLTIGVFALPAVGAGGPETGKDDLDGQAVAKPGTESSAGTIAGSSGRYIVVLEDFVDHPGSVAAAQAQQHGAELGFVYRTALKGYSIADLSRAEANSLRRNPKVASLVPDRKVRAFEQTVPKGIERISATSNPSLDIDGVDDVRINADVAVIDSGVDYTHPDLNVVARVNCVPPSEEQALDGSAAVSCVSGTGTDGYGHGTHVAGTVGAIDNGFGVVGVAPGARIWSVKVLNANGDGWNSFVLAGIDWVTSRNREIEVANMSLGGFGRSVPEEEAIASSVNKGVVYVVAASNDKLHAARVSPANGPDVITVSALTDYDGKPGGASDASWAADSSCVNWGKDDTLADFSNWGSDVEIAAPGVCVYSTIPGGGYEYNHGTSMASPHVAGAAAVLASAANPNSRADVEGIRRQLVDGGNLQWVDDSFDGKVEPILDFSGTPLAATEVATGGFSSDGTGAKLFGSLNARGLPTTYQFQYGTTTAYGQSAPVAPSSLADPAHHSSVSQAIGGLSPGQTYHYRLVATNSSGVTYGSDRTFVTPPDWEVKAPASEPPATGGEWLNDVSCSTQQHCMAVGFSDYNNEERAVAYEKTAAGWVWRSVPHPSGASYSELTGVFCNSPALCTAVGRFYSEPEERTRSFSSRWNGSTWSNLSVPVPNSSNFSVLEDVSCSTTTECVAVGYARNPEPEPKQLWLNFSTRLKTGAWTTLSTPNSADSTASELDSVSCTSSTSCKAVGWYVNEADQNRSVIASWNGTAWSLDTPADPTRTLGGVSCTASNFCMAVGGWPGAEVWNGSSWSNRTVPLPPESVGALESVSCVSATSCTASGFWFTGPRYFGLYTIWDGSKWAQQVVPRDIEKEESFWGISCVALAGCNAVGGQIIGTYDGHFEARADVVTKDAAEVTSAQANLRGSLNPGGLSTTYRFEYGKTTSYGSSAPPNGSSSSASGSTAVSQTVSELQPETTYHYRLAATNSQGTVYGQDKTFRTGAPQHQFHSFFGTSGTGLLDDPWGLEVDAEGNVWVADTAHDRVVKFNANGEYVTHFGASGSGSGMFDEPVDVAIAPNGGLLVTDAGNARVQIFTANGQYLSQFGSSGSGPGQFVEPWGIDVAPDGTIWVSDTRYYRVEQFSAAGAFIREVHGAGQGGSGPAEFAHPTGLEVDSQGHVWVVDSRNQRIQELSSTGQYLSKFGTKGTGPGQFEEPYGLAIKPSGQLLVADRQNGDVQQFTPEGEYVGEFGAGQLVESTGIAIGPVGRVYVSNLMTDRIEKWQQPIPDPVTGSASAIRARTATLNATVNPRGVATAYRFEYGKTTAYGSAIPVPNASAGAGTAAVAVSQQLSGLAPASLYHFRIVATSAQGTIYGNDRTFTTAQPETVLCGKQPEETNNCPTADVLPAGSYLVGGGLTAGSFKVVSGSSTVITCDQTAMSFKTLDEAGTPLSADSYFNLPKPQCQAYGYPAEKCSSFALNAPPTTIESTGFLAGAIHVGTAAQPLTLSFACNFGNGLIVNCSYKASGTVTLAIQENVAAAKEVPLALVSGNFCFQPVKMSIDNRVSGQAVVAK